ncbi:MAG: PHP domain-containing protein, partial [Limisphaerales bacterium]
MKAASLKAFMTDYVELHCRSAFSFLRGASTPEQLAERAAQLGMPAVALCDRDGVYGAPRFFARAREVGVRPIVGAELTMEDGIILPVLARSRSGYANLCRLLTRAHLRNTKGKCNARWDELPAFADGLVALAGSEAVIKRASAIFVPDNLFVEIQRHRVRGEEKANRLLIELAERLRLPLLASNGVLYSNENERPILDVFTCIHHHTHLDAAGILLERNNERYLKSAAQMRELFRDLPQAIENTHLLAGGLDFTLDDLGYEFPSFAVPAGETMDSHLRRQALSGARERYGE